MRTFRFESFGLDRLHAVETDVPEPGPGEVRVEVKALSLNYRDILVVEGAYNPKLRLPATPVSDAAGVVRAVGENVEAVKVGDEVVSVFVSGWLSGPFRDSYVKTTLGTPGPGMAAEQVVLPAAAVLAKPAHLDFAQASTLVCAYLTAWSCLVTEAGFDPSGAVDKTVLTLGTGGVSVAALQLAKLMGCRVAITSSDDDKLARAKQLGADFTVNYRSEPEWAKAVAQWSDGGADLVIDTAGRETLPHSLRAVKGGGTIAVLGALTGLDAELNTGLVMMRRIRLAGVLVDSRAAFQQMLRFVERHSLEPVVDRTEPFERLPEALAEMKKGSHFGKLVLTRS